jgi:hypothetical protein
MDTIETLIQELHTADAERQRTPRGTPRYEDAAARVERIDRAVWRAVERERYGSSLEGSPSEWTSTPRPSTSGSDNVR